MAACGGDSAHPMTIDAHTGIITLSEIGAFISPSLQRAQFLQSPAFAGAQVLIQNEPWCSYGLPLIPLGDTQLSLTFQFDGERLHSLRMAHAAPRFGTAWKDWSEARALQLKAFHDDWLTREMGVPPGHHAWGEVSSTHDPKGGGSGITISYRQ